ncbi:MAG: cation diffusion facilitator family transporter [Pisciglobus halotolerans]|nr:cation diffusion facilitator family transporter [Pisciglobus halotolerans]
MKRLFERIERKSAAKGKELRAAVGRFAGEVGIVSNILLFGVKFLIGVVSGSVSITADAMNNLSDSASSILTVIGFQIAGKPADKEHPYGHQRSEYISGMIISIIMLFVGGQFFRTSIERIMNPTDLRTSGLIFMILGLSIALKIWQGYFYKRGAEYIHSKTLAANAKDSFNDVFTTAAVLISSITEYSFGWNIDGYVGLAIASYIMYSGIKILSEFMNDLLGPRPSEEEINQMTAFLDQYESIEGYHDLLIHSYGPNKTFASVHIEIDDSWSLIQAHEVIDAIEKDFKKQLGISLVCHLDPIAMHSEEQTAIYQKVKQILKSFELDLKFHDFRVEQQKNRDCISFDVVVPEKTKLTNDELLKQIQTDIQATIGDYDTDIVFDRIYLLKK